MTVLRPGGRRLWATAALVVLAALTVVLVVRAVSTRGAGPKPSAQTAAALKPMMSGLLARNGLPAPQHRGLIDGFVVNVRWSELQPERGAELEVNNPIDRALAEVRRIRVRSPDTRLAVKVRLFGGIYAPAWAKNLNGPRLPVTDPLSRVSGTVGRFWTEEYGRAYAELQTKLAARYDSAPEVREITAARCTTVYSEPFIRDARDPATVRALLAAGFTVEADRRCQREQIDAHRVWARTRTGVAFNPYQRISADGSFTVDDRFSAGLMRYCRQMLGQRCVLENNSIRWPQRGPGLLYRTMSELGPPLSFQTATARRVGDLESTLRLAASLGANAVELPEGAYDLANAEALSAADKLLEAQPGHKVAGTP